MTVLGGMSESERQHVQARVLAAMDAHTRRAGPWMSRPGPVWIVRVSEGGVVH
jgi:hypothetical protein